MGGACVGDGSVDSVVEGHSRGSCCHHGDIPVGGEEADRGGGVGAPRPNESPGVIGELEVHCHEWGDGVRADAILVFAVLEGVRQMVVGKKCRVVVDGVDSSIQGRADARPGPWVICVTLW